MASEHELHDFRSRRSLAHETEGLEVAYDLTDGKEALPRDPAPAELRPPLYRDTASVAPLLAKEPPQNAQDRNGRRTWGLPTRWFYVLVCAGVLVVIAAVVGAGVGVTRRGEGRSGMAPSAISNASALAAVSYQDGDNVTHCRVYYQDAEAHVKESAWNASGSGWYVSNDDVVVAKAGTPLTATSFTSENGTTTINLFYMLANDTISQLTSTSDNLAWQTPSGLPPAASRQVDADSKLAAAVLSHYNCSSCSNSTVLAFQNATDLTVASISPDDGTWTFTTLDATPAAGTDMSMFYFAVDSLRLWYENVAQELAFFGLDAGETLWQNRGSLVQNLSSGSPIAAFAYEEPGTDSSVFYQIAYFQNQSSPIAVNVSGWIGDGASNEWTAVYSPPVLTELKYNETVLAANDARRVYTLVDGAITEWEVDRTAVDEWTSWTLLGYVPTE